jgi:hypothetical protein
MKLKLEELAPYLPFKLKCFNQHLPDTKMVVEELIGISNHITWSGIFNARHGSNHIPICGIKPILKPLSDLTKEIEVNGEKFVPLEILGQKHIEDGFFEDGSFGWGQSTGGDDEQDYYLTVSNNEGFYLVFDIWCGHQDEGGYCVDNENIPFPLVELFFKWHFDVFGLIEKGLAINKNTL